MTSRWSTVAPLAAVLLATGCTSTIGGTAVPAPVPPIMRVLLDGATLAKLLAQPFKSAPLFPPSYGGREKFGTAWEDATPPECIGVAFMMQKIVYQSVPVQDVADAMWTNDGQSVKVDDVGEGVISFRSSKDAAGAFATFSGQWRGCDGTTLTAHSVTSARTVVSDVHVADSVVAASLLVHPHEHSILASTPVARALGVRGNYLVEVAVRFFGNDNPAARGTGDINTSAVDIAHAMMDRLSLS
ncbi:sensor domain-containing protein [Mycobacterium sp. Aquia_216]|uniref:sensor domain-containing protein n=1 Tax=Mycobacterium sp. Aquia_216 TaxID=2991729 RepID=UPI00227B81A2|nr:sensor domain-containing protein [Mycobacterium sp. Aquia_216]WAJ43653.1 sensor domain-containing protein [Mycobacterium sp. Aquia_216]